jgi:hypothetical protein
MKFESFLKGLIPRGIIFFVGIGVVSAQAPGNVSTQLRVWLKADALSTGTVTSWTDASGMGNAPTQNTAADQPINQDNIINYNRAVNFSASDFLRLNGPSLGTLGNTRKEVFYVVYQGRSVVMFLMDTAATSQPIDDLNLAYTSKLTLGGINTSRTASPLRCDETHNSNLITNITNETQTTLIGTDYSINFNGHGFVAIDDVTNNPTNATTTGTDAFIIGCKLNADVPPVKTGFLRGHLAELILYSRSMVTTTDREKVTSYLGIKYGQTLGHNYLSSNGTIIYDVSTYNNDIIGIGRDDNSDLIQKQSKSAGDSLKIYIDNLSATNQGNTGTFSADESFIVLGDNQGILASNTAANTEIPGTCGLHSRLEREWKVQRTNSTEDFNLDITLNPMASAGSVNIADLTLLVDNDGDFSNGGTTCYFNGDGTGISFTYSNPVISVTGISTTHMNNNATSYFTIGSSNSGTPLPVELLNFNASLSEQKTVELNWITTTELNNDFFTIERSNNGINWEPIKEIDGAGNSSSLLSYSTIDQDPYFGISFYRLKQTDFDGQYEYSQIRSVKLERLANSQIEIYPNPTNNKIILIGNTSELEDIKIFNCLGQDVTTYITITKSNEKESVVIDMAKLTIGMYYVKTKTTANKVYKQ